MNRRVGAGQEGPTAGRRARRPPSLPSLPSLLLAASAVVLGGWLVVIPAALAPSGAPAAAQEPGEDEPVVGDEEETEGQEGQNQETEGEVGAGEGETEGAAEETGPPWTYQMAWLGVLLLLALGGGVAFWYYRFVLRRQRAGF